MKPITNILQIYFFVLAMYTYIQYILFSEMLAKFTEEELLEGNIYACEKCNRGK